MNTVPYVPAGGRVRGAPLTGPRTPPAPLSRPHLPRSSPASRTSASLRSGPSAPAPPPGSPRPFRHTSRQTLDFRRASRKSRLFRNTTSHRPRPLIDHAHSQATPTPRSSGRRFDPRRRRRAVPGAVPGAVSAPRSGVELCPFGLPASAPLHPAPPRSSEPPAAPGVPVRDERGTVRGSVRPLCGRRRARVRDEGCGVGGGEGSSRDSARCGRGEPSGSFHSPTRRAPHRDALSPFAGHREHFPSLPPSPPQSPSRGGGRCRGGRAVLPTRRRYWRCAAPNRAVPPTPPALPPGEPPGCAPHPAARRCGRGGAVRSWHRRRWDGTKRSAALRRRRSSSARTAIRAPRGGEGRRRTDGRRRSEPRNRGDTAGDGVSGAEPGGRRSVPASPWGGSVPRGRSAAP